MSRAAGETLEPVFRELPRQRAAAVPVVPKRAAWLPLGGLLVLATGALLVALKAGAYPISGAELLAIIGQRLGLGEAALYDAVKADIFWSIRLPRVLLAFLVGGGLAMSGVAIQGMFRNPLAEPGLLGVSAGAALAAAVFIKFRATVWMMPVAALGFWALPLMAFLGATLAMLLIYRLGSCAGRTAVATLLLAGIAINALAGAGTGLLLFAANDEQLRDITFWTMGSLAGANWRTLCILGALIVPACCGMQMLARALNALLLGEAEAGHLGISVELTKRLLIVLVGMTVGVSVAFTGVIGFIGLVVPHLARLIFRPDHRLTFPVSALLGGTLLLTADAVARSVAAPLDLPIGTITALGGAPFFLVLLLRTRGRGLL